MKEILKNINKKEWLFVLLAAIILVIITTFPTVYGFLVDPSDKFFPALHSNGPGDYNVYYSYIEQAKQGDLLFKDIFTSESHDPFLFNPLWLMIGFGGKIFDLPNVLTFQLSRILLIIPFAFVLYFFISYFIKEAKLRRYCFTFSILASGLGGLFIPLIRNIYADNFFLRLYPMDLWVSEGQTFLTLYHSAHFILATMLVMIIFLLMLLSFRKNIMRYTIWAGFLALFLFFFHPFHLITVLAVLTVYIFVASFRSWKPKWDYLKKFVVFILISSPAIIYHFLLLLYNPIAKGRADQNVCLTPYFWVVLISYGLLLPFALWGLKRRPKKSHWVFLATWLIVQAFLIFSPLHYQRRLTQGLQIPLTIFAFLGLHYFYLRIIKKWPSLNLSQIKPLVILVLLIFFGFSNIYVIAQDLSFYTYPEYKEWPDYMYLDKEYKEAFDWLYHNLGKDDIVLSDTITGSFIAGFSAKRIYVGHWVETLRWREKIKTTTWFYGDNGNDKEKKEFLKKENITYVFYSQFEGGFNNFNLPQKDYLKPVFKAGNVLILEVLSR